MPEIRFPARLAPSRPVKTVRLCPAHRSWVRRHRCSVRGCERVPIECAHVRGATNAGLGMKPSDRWTVSLCWYHHREQHQLGERSFEAKYDLDLHALASEFARRSPHRLKLDD